MEPVEPIAIVGMACRFAGGIDSLSGFWTLLREGRDSIGEVPPDRWAWYTTQGHEYARAVRDVTSRGAFLDDVQGFDADFFDITPREAALMDPQQRIMLELAWEALEHAGIPPDLLAGTDTGVFMGVGSDDYGRGLLEDLPRIEAWTGIGGAYCGVPNRVSYVLDLRGPSVAIDTACSSSLVAIHLATQALRAGECPVAIAGGVLVMAAPGLSLVLDAAGATAPDGRCKSFDASADGYGRGEGGGVVVLKRLADAQRDGDRVLALIRGSAVHQDGRTNGIMAPSGEAQAHLMLRTYQAAAIDPATVDYVEAHGTGTRAGDPLEAGAMSVVFGSGRLTRQPCLIGSVKPNIGHLEAGAGVAGVIKTVLALRHGEIPPSINVTKPNPAIAWESSGLRVVTELTPWPAAGRPRRAGVSGYGYGGTIAHLVLEEAPASTVRPAPADGNAATDGPLRVFPLSAASPRSVEQYASRLADWLVAGAGEAIDDVGYTLAHRRTHLPNRAAVLAADREQLVQRLRELPDSGTGSATGTVLPAGGRGLVWVFSGHGSQWIGMARELLANEPAFASVIGALEPVFVSELGISPGAAIRDDADQPVDVIQPMIFAVQVALAAVWRANGVRPAAVIGHSVGEIAAAVTAGMLTLEQGARLVCRRSILLRRVAGRGAMVMVNLPADDAEGQLAGVRDVAVAVEAAPGSTVVSGDAAAIEQLRQRWHSAGLLVRQVDSDVAFHSPHMDPLSEALAEAVADLSAGPAEIPVYSTALVDPRSGAPRDGSYWATNLRQRVRFQHAVRAAAEDGFRLFVEIAPHPVVEHSINETLDALGIDDAYVAHSLRRHQPERATLLTNLGLLYCHGAVVDWSALWPAGDLADLPATVWQHKPHWAERPARQLVPAGQHDPASHHLLGGRTSVSGATPAHAWLTHVDRESRPYPGRHPVREVEIIPAAVLLNTFLAAASTTGPWSDLVDVALRVPVSLNRPRDLQVVQQDRTIRISSRIAGDTADEHSWVPHTTAAIEPHTGFAGPRIVAATEQALPTGFVVDRLASLGVAAMGFSWTVESISCGEGTLLAEVRADQRATTTPGSWAPILDAALSTASVVFPGPPVLRMPAHIHRVTLAEKPPAWAQIAVRVTGGGTVDVELTDPDGAPAGRLSRLQYGALESEVGAFTHPRRLVYEVAWRPAELRRSGAVPDMVLVGPSSALRKRLVDRLASAGVRHRVAATPEQLRDEELARGHAIVVVPAPARPGDAGPAAVRSSWLLARVAQRIASAAPAALPRLWCVTQGVQESVDEAALGYGSLWGLGRVIGGERPDLWGGIVDVGPSAEDLDELVDVLRASPGEDVIVVRGGQPSVPRLHPPERGPTRPPMTCRPDGTYLVTGGLGALGRQIAQYLADRGARRIVLAGRRALPPRDHWDRLADHDAAAQIEAVRSLERLGVTATTVAVDIADASAARRLLSPAALGMPPIRGVVHAAGVLDNRTLHTLDEDSLRTVMRPKVDGALVLHALFPPGSVDFFVLFSSCGQLLGLPGQASYAAANAFLDALAAHRHAAGDAATTSYGWTSWRGLGMSTSSEVIEAELAARGTADISQTEAFAAWTLAERYDLSYAAVLRTIPLEAGERRLPLLSELPEAGPTDQAAAQPVAAPWLDLAEPELRAVLTEEVRRHVASETNFLPADVDPHRPLVEMGIDSVMTVRIRRALERRFQLTLPATVFWDRPTVDAVASLLAELVDGGAPAR